MSQLSDQTVEIKTDVLVIGGGSAGVWAAIRARELGAKVTLVDKAKVARSGASTFIHGILAPLADSDLDGAMKEIVEQGEYLCDQTRLKAVLTEHGSRIRQMEEWGVPFLRDPSGAMYQRKGRMHVINNAIYAPGVDMMQKMKDHAVKIGVDIVERVMVTDLLTSDGRHPTSGSVIGAVGFHARDGGFYVFHSGATVLAAGPMSAKLHCVFSDNLAGDGYAMAIRAGTEMAGMEVGQHPYFPIWARKHSGVPPGVIQTYGGKPVNRLGEAILEKYYPGRTSQMLNRTQFGYVMAKETLDGRGPVHLDLAHWTDEIVNRVRTVLPSDMKNLDEDGLDLRTQQLEAAQVVAVWWANIDGGVKTDVDGRSSVSGLFATGCNAHEAVNYADSSGVSQAGCYTSGYRAGTAATKFARDAGRPEGKKDQVGSLKKEIFAPLGRSKGASAEEVYLAVNKATLPAESCYFKHERRIMATLEEVRRARDRGAGVKASDIHDLVKARGAVNFAEVVELAYHCSLEREESRLCHYREEFPYRDDVNWLKWVVARKGTDGIRVRTEDLPIADYPVKPLERKKIPAPVQVTLEGKKKSVKGR